MTIPRINQIPLNQPMYVNGQLHQTWIDFFQKVGAVADETGVYSLSAMNDAIGNIQVDVASIKQSIQVINLKINSIQDTILGIENRLNTLETNVTTNTNDIADLQSKYAALAIRVTTLENK